MKKTAITASLSLAAGSAAMAYPPVEELKDFAIEISGFSHGERIPSRFAFCMPDGQGRAKEGGNINPEIRWSGAPKGTKSYALIVVDPDVPKDFYRAGDPSYTIPADYPRQNFYHWVLVDIPANIEKIAEGEDSQGIIKGGKPIGKLRYGLTGPNDYKVAYGGSFGGYDGPCPPWNDARMHHYHFIVYALDVETLGLSGPPTGKIAEDAIAGHVLAKAEMVGTYTQYPPLLENE